MLRLLKGVKIPLISSLMDILRVFASIASVISDAEGQKS